MPRFCLSKGFSLQPSDTSVAQSSMINLVCNKIPVQRTLSFTTYQPSNVTNDLVYKIVYVHESNRLCHFPILKQANSIIANTPLHDNNICTLLGVLSRQQNMYKLLLGHFTRTCIQCQQRLQLPPRRTNLKFHLERNCQPQPVSHSHHCTAAQQPPSLLPPYYLSAAQLPPCRRALALPPSASSWGLLPKPVHRGSA